MRAQADVSAFDACGCPGEEFPHALRWFIHIDSFSHAAKKALPGKYVAAKKAAAAEEDVDLFDDDEDVDLFGDDDDEDEDDENEKRLAAVAEAHKQKKIAAGKFKSA